MVDSEPADTRFDPQIRQSGCAGLDSGSNEEQIRIGTRQYGNSI